MDSRNSNMEETMVVGIDDLADLKGISIAHWNSRSLYPKLDDVKIILKNSNLEIFFYY